MIRMNVFDLFFTSTHNLSLTFDLIISCMLNKIVLVAHSINYNYVCAEKGRIQSNFINNTSYKH